MKEEHKEVLMACDTMTKLKAAKNKGYEKELSLRPLEHDDSLKDH